MNVGTGKSTLVQHLIAALQIPEVDVVYCAYTGKASLVLRSKGCMNAFTLHKLLYNARYNSRTGTYSFIPKSSLDHAYKIIVIDEVSMLSAEMWALLQKHHAYIIALGDPGQLGPVRATDSSDLLKNPHIFLDEIMRQEEGNEIIKLSMNIRNGFPLSNFQGQHVQIINPTDLTEGMLTWADQIICAKNDTRFHLNGQLRVLQGKEGDPQIGDKLICLKNSWDTISDIEETPLVNGTIGFITKVNKVYEPRLGFDILRIDLETEVGEVYSNLIVDYKLITQNVSSLTKADYGRLARNERTKALIPKDFAYGYAITAWKSQGSEWDNVLLFEESFPWEAIEHKRYLYTGVTRASSKIVVVRK